MPRSIKWPRFEAQKLNKCPGAYSRVYDCFDSFIPFPICRLFLRLLSLRQESQLVYRDNASSYEQKTSRFHATKQQYVFGQAENTEMSEKISEMSEKISEKISEMLETSEKISEMSEKISKMS